MNENKYPYSQAMYYIAKAKAELTTNASFEKILEAAHTLLAKKYHYSNGKMRFIKMKDYDFILIDYCLSYIAYIAKELNLDKGEVHEVLNAIKTNVTHLPD